MAWGLPVVSANSGGVAETVGPSGAGKLFKAHDERDFVHCVEEMLRADLPALGRKMRRYVMQNYGWDVTFQQMVDRYEELRDAKRSSAGVAPRRDPGSRVSCTPGSVQPQTVGPPGTRPGCCA